MIKTEYKRDMGRNYIVFREGIALEEGYFLKLIQNSSIEGILSLEVRVIDGKKECYCDITGKQSLKMVFDRSGIDKEQLKEIIGRIREVIKRGEEYLLKPEDYALAAETIFLDLSDFSLYLCYLPGYRKPMEEKWKEFTEYLMNAVDYKKEETVLYVYSLYKAARQPGGMTEELLWEDKEENREKEKRTVPKQICTLVPEFEERIEEDETIEVYPGKIYIWAAAAVFAAVLAAAGGLFLWRPGPVQAGAYLLIVGALCVYGLSHLFSPENKETRIEHQVEFIPVEGERDEGQRECSKTDSIFEWQRQEEENTVVLAAEGFEKNCFLRAEDSHRYQDIELIEFPFFFGKLRTQVNSSIESPAVSRFHAKIEHLGGEYYLVDLNSTNGTYLNGERLKAHERKKLEPMDKVRFADVGYSFEV